MMSECWLNHDKEIMYIRNYKVQVIMVRDDVLSDMIRLIRDLVYLNFNNLIS